MEPTEAKNTANEKLTHNKENTGKEAGTAPKEKIVLESGKNSSDKDKNGYKERLKEITAVLHKHAITRGVSPEKLRLILTDLGPTFIKLGQVMSMRSDILPKRYCDELMKLCSDVEPMPFSEVEEVLQEAFWLSVAGRISGNPEEAPWLSLHRPGAPRRPENRGRSGGEGSAKGHL